MSLPTIDLNWTELFADLKVDETHVRALLAEQGLYGAARILGYDVNHYHNLSVAGRLTVEHMRMVAPKSILAYAEVMKGNLSRPVYQFIQKHSTVLQSCLDKTRIRDYDHDWFSANTLYTTYSAAPDFNSEKAETPQYIWMRIALEFYHDEGLEEVLQCYHDLSIGYYTPASPTIFNAGFVKNQMASCFLMSLGDNLESILRRGIHDGGIISKHSGGLGVDVSCIRHSEIQHAGWSSGVVPMLQMFNSLTYYVNQCFDPDTYVYTERGPVQIRDIVPGDKLIIYNGTFHEVAFLMPHDYQGSVVELKVQSSFRPVKVALSHPLLVKRGDNEEWVDAGRIRVGDDVAFPVPKLVQDRTEIGVEDMYMYGLMLGSGSINREGVCKIEVPKDHPLNLALFIRQYLGVRALAVKESPRMDQVSFEWKEHANFRFTRTSIYNVKEEKNIHPHYLHLPREKTTSFIAGLMTQLGSYGAECKFSFAFECLAESVRYLLLRLGYSITCSYRENKLLHPLPPVYQIKFPHTYEIGKFFNDLNFTDRVPSRDTLIWSEVQHLIAMPYQGRIYDLQMVQSPERSCTDLIGSANYLTQVGLAHNGGRRKGAATIFLRSHHIDIEEFIEMPRKVGDRYARAHDLNICIWTSWLFWERLRTDGMWTLFCPAKTPQLNEVYGKEFERLYLQAEADTSIHPRYRKQVRARDLYHKMITTMNESGMPYLMNGDAANLKSNHRHLGYIKSSNLCLEIIEYTDEETIAVCNLHSLSLRTFAQAPLTSAGGLTNAINFPQLALIVRRVTNNLNKVIDHNWYPLDKRDGEGNVIKPKVINKSNKKHRPVGMGVSGFAELLHILELPFEDPLVSLVNKSIFACMYWNALAQSVQLALIHGPYESFPGSPTSEGKLQFDLWREEFEILGPNAARCAADDEPLPPNVWNQEPFLLTQEGVHIDTIAPTWEDLKRVIKKYGLRNSLLIALMPTASTAQVRRNCESVEAHQNNLYSRKVLKCSYPVLNRFLVADLDALGAWNDHTVEFMQVRDGSIQGLGQYILTHPEYFPNFVASASSGSEERMRHIERKYKTMWEIPQKVFMKLAAERGRYVDQSASTNIYLKDCQKEKLQACHLYANMLGLKTIMYYLRQSGGETVKFTAEPSMIKYIKGLKVDGNTKEDIKPSPEPKLNELEGLVDEVKPKRKVVCNDEVCLSCT